MEEVWNPNGHWEGMQAWQCASGMGGVKPLPPQKPLEDSFTRNLLVLEKQCQSPWCWLWRGSVAQLPLVVILA